jgi:hypothetical protein
MRNDKYITKIVAASLLGDASIEKDKRDNGNTNFSISLIQEHKDHLDYLAAVISEITSVSWYEKHQTEIARKPQIRLRSKRHPFYNSFYERMYGTGRKSPDPHYLTLLDAEFLAVWYMQDGYYSNGGKLALATNSFSYGEQMLLRAALKEKLDINWNVKNFTTSKGNRQYILQAGKDDRDKIIEIMLPYIQPSFMYKMTRMLSPDNKSGDDIVSSL